MPQLNTAEEVAAYLAMVWQDYDGTKLTNAVTALAYPYFFEGHLDFMATRDKVASQCQFILNQINKTSKDLRGPLAFGKIGASATLRSIKHEVADEALEVTSLVHYILALHGTQRVIYLEHAALDIYAPLRDRSPLNLSQPSPSLALLQGIQLALKSHGHWMRCTGRWPWGIDLLASLLHEIEARHASISMMLTGLSVEAQHKFMNDRTLVNELLDRLGVLSDAIKNLTESPGLRASEWAAIT